MAIQLPASTASPAAILIHIARSALGEIFRSAKKLSRRRRKTLGKEDAPDRPPIDCHAAGSDGTRSSKSAVKVIPVSVSDVTGASTIILSQPRASCSAASVAQVAVKMLPHRLAASKLIVSLKFMRNQGDS